MGVGMSDLARRLDVAIKAANVPIVGVSVGDALDKSTWKVSPGSLQAQAQPVIDAFVVDDQAIVAAEKDREIDNMKALRALGEATVELKTNTWTKAQFLARVKAIYRGL